MFDSVKFGPNHLAKVSLCHGMPKVTPVRRTSRWLLQYPVVKFYKWS